MKKLTQLFTLLPFILWNISAIAAPPTYAPVGPQTNIPVATVTGGGWTECHRDLYNVQGLDTTTVLAGCTGQQLMLACRPTGSATLTLLAQAPSADVVFDTGDNITVTHSANGTGWYQSGARGSWGFALDGDTVSKTSCDTDGSGANDQRLCWHTAPRNAGSGGYRCGTTQNINNSALFERIVYQADAPAPTDVPTLSFWGLGLMSLLLMFIARRKAR